MRARSGRLPGDGRGRRLVALCIGVGAALFALLAVDREGTEVSRPAAHVGQQFPSPSNTGVAAGWVPAQTQTSDMVVTQPGTVIEDTRFTGGSKLTIMAEDVTVRNSEFQGGSIRTDGYPGVVIEDVTIDRLRTKSGDGEGVISYCNYTAIRVKILDRSEGFRESCDLGATTTIRDSFIRIRPPATCTDWHGDGIQGYGGVNLRVSNVTIDFHQTEACPGTSPFFYVGGAGGSPKGEVHIDGLLLKGGGYSFRMGTRGSVRGLKVVDGSWVYAPIDITDAGCGAISSWDAQTVEVDGDWRVTRAVRDLSCTTGA
jgi:hypothetical protein